MAFFNDEKLQANSDCLFNWHLLYQKKDDLYCAKIKGTRPVSDINARMSQKSEDLQKMLGLLTIRKYEN